MPDTGRTYDEMRAHFGDLTRDVLFGNVWEQPGLSKRDRSLITISVLTALYRTEQLRGHIKRGLDNGLGREEIMAAIEHMAFYSGWPCAVNGFNVAKEVFAEADGAK